MDRRTCVACSQTQIFSSLLAVASRHDARRWREEGWRHEHTHGVTDPTDPGRQREATGLADDAYGKITMGTPPARQQHFADGRATVLACLVHGPCDVVVNSWRRRRCETDRTRPGSKELERRILLTGGKGEDNRRFHSKLPPSRNN
jgi:hypothetical protein